MHKLVTTDNAFIDARLNYEIFLNMYLTQCELNRFVTLISGHLCGKCAVQGTNRIHYNCMEGNKQVHT